MHMSSTHSTAINFSEPVVTNTISTSTPISSASSSASNSPPHETNTHHSNGGSAQQKYPIPSNPKYAGSGVDKHYGSMLQCDTEQEIPASVISSVGSVNYQKSATQQIFMVSNASWPVTTSSSLEYGNMIQSQQSSHILPKYQIANEPPLSIASGQKSPVTSNSKMVQPSAAPRLHPKKRKFDLAELDASPPTTPMATSSSNSVSFFTPTATSSPSENARSSNSFHSGNSLSMHKQVNDLPRSVPPTKMVSLAKVLDDSYQQHSPELPKAIQEKLQQMSSGNNMPVVSKNRSNVRNNIGLMDQSCNDQDNRLNNDWSAGVPPNKMVSLAKVLDDGYQFASDQPKIVVDNINDTKNLHTPTSAGFVLTNMPPTNANSLLLEQHQQQQQQYQPIPIDSSMDTLDLMQWENHRVLAKQGNYFVAGCIRTAISHNSVLVELNHPEGTTQIYHDVLGNGRFDVISDASPSVSDVCIWIYFMIIYFTKCLCAFFYRLR